MARCFFSADDGVHGTELWAVASPKADAGGPYTFSINTSVVLSGMGSSDSDPTEMLTYEWDLDGDGIFGEVGSNAARGDEFGREVAFRRPPGYQPGTYTVSLRVSNSVGLSGTATTSVTLREAGFVGTAGDDSSSARTPSCQFSFAPPRTSLFPKNNRAHGLLIRGPVEELAGCISLDDAKQLRLFTIAHRNFPAARPVSPFTQESLPAQRSPRAPKEPRVHSAPMPPFPPPAPPSAQ